MFLTTCSIDFNLSLPIQVSLLLLCELVKCVVDTVTCSIFCSDASNWGPISFG